MTDAVDAAERAKFDAMAADWWDPDGPMRPLHAQSPARIALIREAVCARFGRDAAADAPFEGLRIADVGCGGGLLCEPLARMGADVVGVDASAAAIDAAKTHAASEGLTIDYRCAVADALGAAGERFDVVLAMEVIEHTPDPRRFVDDAAKLVKPGGLLFGSTLNRTAKAFALAVVGAEYVLRWLPAGTHDWRRFVRPSEFKRYLTGAGLRVIDRRGIVFDPLRRRWTLSTRDLDVNYALVAERPG